MITNERIDALSLFYEKGCGEKEFYLISTGNQLKLVDFHVSDLFFNMFQLQISNILVYYHSISNLFIPSSNLFISFYYTSSSPSSHSPSPTPSSSSPPRFFLDFYKLNSLSLMVSLPSPFSICFN